MLSKKAFNQERGEESPIAEFHFKEKERKGKEEEKRESEEEGRKQEGGREKEYV